MKTNIFMGLKDFFILWSTQTLSGFGTAMTNFALVIWVYQQAGTAQSLTLLMICAFLPTICFRFIAGAIADRWNKKRIMLISDLIAACGTAAIWLLYRHSALQIWHLYVINTLMSFMNAFQSPAAYVATSLLVPKDQYLKVSGLQSFAGSTITILAPALGSALLTFGGLEFVLMLDLMSFAVAFIALLMFIKIPDIAQKTEAAKETFIDSCMAGINYLREHAGMLRLILFFAAVNFLAKMGNDGMLPVFILSKSNGDQQALGMAQAAVALGILVGSLLVTFIKPARRKTRLIFIACACTFALGGVGLSLSRTLMMWLVCSFLSYVPVAILGANLTAVMREGVPVEMQGRVFSAQSTLQNFSIPIGLYLGGVLADHLFEPFMAKVSPIRSALVPLFGAGKGAGVALMFFIVGIIGCLMSLSALRNPIYRSLDTKQ